MAAMAPASTRDLARIRNFSIIAHIDHGKTTLTDQFLRLTLGASSASKQRELDKKERILDSNPIEQERGITIKLAPVRMEYEHDGVPYVLNLIDTPGHVDFSYEVSRSLAACEGALLVVDASQGIQAQSLSTYEKAKALGLKIIPVLNKIDLPSAEVERAALEVMELTGCDEADILQVSAKTGKNVEAVLQAIIEKIPAPEGDFDAPARALLLTSHFDQHKGAIALVRVIDGEFSRQKLHFISGGVSFLPVEIGTFTPDMTPRDTLGAGEVGYVATGLKDARSLKIGDTLTTAVAAEKEEVVTLSGYREPQPMVYMELYPADAADFSRTQDAMQKLALRDAALQFSGTYSQALGSGLRVGFLGILHAEIVLERLKREFDLELIATSPSVTYEVTTTQGEVMTVRTPGEMPDPSTISQTAEPIASVLIYTPKEYLGEVLNLCSERRGIHHTTKQVGERLALEFSLPLAELITDFHDLLKSMTSGYASLEYQVKGYKPVEAVKVEVLLNKEPVEALSFISVREDAQRKGRKLVGRLKEVLPRQAFEVPIQAAIGGTIIARETLKAFRKDVTAKLYGGDVSRRKKLLAKQAKGKKRMKQFGKVTIEQDTFLQLLRQS